MTQGTVKWFNERKGFGFITTNDGKEYFVHHTSINGNGFKTLQEGEDVEFEIENGEKGMKAVQVTVV